MDRKLNRSVAQDGLSPISNHQSTAKKYVAAAGGFFQRRHKPSHRSVKSRNAHALKKQRAANIDTDEELEQDDANQIQAWHLMVHTVASLRKERDAFEEVTERAEVDNAISEARALISELNIAYGWESGEPAVADRMFGVNVRAVLADAAASGTLNFRTKKMIDTLRATSRGSQGGRSRIASVAAVRNLVGGVTSNEAQLQEDQKRLKADDFAELVGMADRLCRAEELALSAKLGRRPAPATRHDVNPNQLSVADDRSLRRRGFSL